MAPRPLIVSLLLGLVSPAVALDVPAAGRALTLRASAARPGGRAASLLLEDAAIAAPFPDPTLGSGLVVSGGAAEGQCRAEIALDPTRWKPIGGNGAQRGWRYRASQPAIRSAIRRRVPAARRGARTRI